MKALSTITLCYFFSFLSYGQSSKFYLYTEINAASYHLYSFHIQTGPLSFGLEDIKYLGSNIRLGMEYNIKWWQVGIKLDHYSYANTETHSNNQLEYVSDLKDIGLQEDFYQLNTTISKRQIALYVGAHKTLFKKYNVRLNYGLISLSRYHQQQIRFIPKPVNDYENRTEVGFILDTDDHSFSALLIPYQFITFVIQRPLYKTLNIGVNYQFIPWHSDHSVGLHLSTNF